MYGNHLQQDAIIDNIMEDLFQAPWLVLRKLLNVEDSNITRRHFAILGTLDRVGVLPVSEIGKRLLISRPQMTYLVDKLIGLGMVERLPDKNDRRITNLTLTSKGKTVLEENRQSLRHNMIQKLSRLKKEELEELSASLRKIRDIGSKLD